MQSFLYTEQSRPLSSNNFLKSVPAIVKDIMTILTITANYRIRKHTKLCHSKVHATVTCHETQTQYTEEARKRDFFQIRLPLIFGSIVQKT